MTSFALKIIALISMLISHTGYIISPNIKEFLYIGRIAFPIFAYQISEGYTHTKDIKKYIFRLLFLAIISQYPFKLLFANNEIYLNTIFTLLLGLIGIIIYEKNKIYCIIYITVTAIITYYIHFDYGIIGILLILCFHVFRNKKELLSIIYIVLFTCLYGTYILKYKVYNINVIKLIIHYLPYYMMALVALPIILTHNKKEGKKIKLLYYIFYPLHLYILIILKYLI